MGKKILATPYDVFEEIINDLKDCDEAEQAEELIHEFKQSVSEFDYHCLLIKIYSKSIVLQAEQFLIG